jgi:threonine/homoserine/homoserine lactone efflux protein
MIGGGLVLYWLAWAMSAGSPGPATLSIAGTSMANGRRSGIIFAMGISTGSACWGLAAAMGMSAVMMANVWLFETVKYLGAAYLLFLSVKSLRSALSDKAELSQRAYGGTTRQIFTKGALIHLTNPKAVLGWGAIYAIMVPAQSTVTELFAMYVFLLSASIFVFIGYAFLFSTVKVVALYQSTRRIFELVFASFFGFASIKVLTTKLPSLAQTLRQ